MHGSAGLKDCQTLKKIISAIAATLPSNSKSEKSNIAGKRITISTRSESRRAGGTPCRPDSFQILRKGGSVLGLPDQGSSPRSLRPSPGQGSLRHKADEHRLAIPWAHQRQGLPGPNRKAGSFPRLCSGWPAGLAFVNLAVRAGHLYWKQ